MLSLRRVIAVTAALLTAGLCLVRGQERANPLLSKSALPFHAPQFDQIKDADFQPAIEAGIREERAEIQKIAGDPAAPTFENTIEALERSGQLLARVQMIFALYFVSDLGSTDGRRRPVVTDAEKGTSLALSLPLQ